MSERRDARLRAAALGVTGLSAALALIAILFGLLNLDAAASLGTTAFDPNYTTSFIVTVVGLLIAWRHPGHLVAWTFLARVRNEVELENVRADLLDAVNSTVRPSHAGMWLRGDRR